MSFCLVPRTSYYDAILLRTLHEPLADCVTQIYCGIMAPLGEIPYGYVLLVFGHQRECA